MKKSTKIITSSLIMLLLTAGINEVVGVEEMEDFESEETERVEQLTTSIFSIPRVNASQPHYTTTFINTISPHAMELGKEYGLYPSVIIAQAALESGWGGKSPALPDDYILSLPPNYNLFGVKGDHKGQSVAVNTKEYDKKKDEYIDVVDYFRKYPSYRESIEDYVKKMRYNTTTTDPYFYSGVWVENADTYKKATSYLTGRYATDPEYGAKLNRTIENYNLTRFDELVYANKPTDDSSGDTNKSDEKEVTPSGEETGSTGDINDPSDGNDKPPVVEESSSENSNNETAEETATVNSQTVAYEATLNTNILIYTQPNSDDVVKNSNELASSNIVVREEAEVDGKLWVRVESSGQSIGWLDANNITSNYDIIHSENTVAYTADIKNSRFEIFSRPAYTANNYQTANAQNYFEQPAIIRGEVVTDRATWVQLEVNGQIIGWMNKNGITPNYDEVQSEHTVAYLADIKNSRFEMFSRPAYTADNFQTANAETYFGQSAIVRAEAVTKRATWVQLEVNGEIVGWMNKNGITPNYDEIHLENTVAYAANLKNARFELFSRPAYTNGNKQSALASDYFGQSAIVRSEAVTDRATWVQLEVGGQIIGWMNKNGITPNYDEIKSEHIVAYVADIKNSRFELFSRPAYTNGNKQTTPANKYFGKSAIVRAEAETDRATWVQLEVDGKAIGWMNKKGITPNYDRVRSERTTNYKATLNSSRYELFSRPAYTVGNIQIVNANNYHSRTVNVRSEAVTNRGNWVLLQVHGAGNYIGWINKNAITVN